MADVKWSALSAAGAAAAADYLVGLQTGAAVKSTLAQVKTFVNNAPAFAAGSATAASWPVFTPGSTLLSAAVAGTIETDATNMYGCTDAGNRGIIPIDQYTVQTATRTWTSDTNPQPIFNASTNGALTIATGLYIYECLVYLSSMSASSGNGKFGIGGGATLTKLLQYMQGIDGAIDTVIVGGGNFTASATQGGAAVVSVTTATTLCFVARGSFNCTGAGTIIPQFAQANASAAVTNIGSYFWIRRLGAAGATTVGNWS